MKFFRLLGMAVIAVCMCANFTACSQDDGSNGGGGAGEKKLVKMVDGYDNTYIFVYDDKGRATNIQIAGYDGDTYIWSNNTIECHWSTGQLIFTVENGLVQKEEFSSGSYNETFIYTYDNANRSTVNMTWDGDRLVLGYLGDRKYKFNYTGQTCKKGFLPLNHLAYVRDVLFCVHPELIGARTQQLPTSATYTDFINSSNEGGTITYKYEFDSEGYISKIIVEYDNGNTYSISLTWK